MSEGTLKRQLLAEASKKPVRGFIQFDADATETFRIAVLELRNAPYPVRVQIREDTGREETLKALLLILKWLAQDWPNVQTELEAERSRLLKNAQREQGRQILMALLAGLSQDEKDAVELVIGHRDEIPF